MPLVDDLLRVLSFAFGMAWEITWALILGFVLSAVDEPRDRAIWAWPSIERRPHPGLSGGSGGRSVPGQNSKPSSGSATALQGTEVDGPPGQAFLYNNYNPLLVGVALERATGQNAASYLEQHLWQPMRAEYPASWSLDSKVDGFEKMESGINARAIDFAKFGLLYLRHGRWGDQQVIPADWVAASTTPQAAPGSPAGTKYGYFWWVYSGNANPPIASRFFARGNLGQFIFVAPDANLVVVRLGRAFGYERWNELLDQLTTEIAAARAPSRLGAP